MPTLHVHIMQGHTLERRRAFLKAATDAVVQTLSAPVASVRVLLSELDPQNIIVAGEFDVDVALLRVMLIAGRTEQAKAAAIEALTQVAVEHLGVDGAQVRVILTDVPNTDMGMAHGKTAKAMGR